ncbi:Zinc finger MYM-type protein 3, partial [Stegodyphus mimosarum]
MYFNTKYFKLKTVEDHARFSFTHVTKHWKKSASKGGTRNVLLRYYPPLIKDFSKRHKDENAVYEQVENVSNPLRCPVKLYEFYMSKCPECVKVRNDIFYLYPERSCVPDSPVWYSTQPLGQEIIAKMIQRIKIVR